MVIINSFHLLHCEFIIIYHLSLLCITIIEEFLCKTQEILINKGAVISYYHLKVNFLNDSNFFKNL